MQITITIRNSVLHTGDVEFERQQGLSGKRKGKWPFNLLVWDLTEIGVSISLSLSFRKCRIIPRKIKIKSTHFFKFRDVIYCRSIKASSHENT